MDPATREQLHDLLAALMEDDLDDAQQVRLGEILREHAEARELYRRAFDLHADLALRGDGAPVVEVAAPRTPAASDGSGRWKLGLSLMAAAALILGLTVGWRAGARLTPPIAHVMTASGADGSLRNARALHRGVFAIVSGEARLQMTSGVKVKLSGAASVELLDPKSIRLVRGSVSIDVPEQAIGFRVITPNADVVDLGTEFGVSVEDDGSTEVHVFRGVVVTRPFDGTRVVPLMEREAGLLDPVNAELQPIPLNASRFGLAEPAAPAQAPASVAMDRLPDGARVVFLGDRMTARETHLTLINQALRPLTAQAAPQLFNAGIAFPLFFEEEDFKRYVTAYRPTHAVLEFGPDIARFVRPQTPDNFEKAVARLVDRLIDAGVEPILTTGYPYEVGMEDAQSRLDRYNDRLRALAAERRLRLVDIDRAFRTDGEQGRSYVLRKLNLPTFEGFRLAARTLLDAMGYGAFAVPTSTDPQPMPGLIERWRYRYVPDAEKLDAKSIRNVAPDETWEALSLPMEAKYSKRLADPSHAWSFQEARRGFTMGLFRRGHRVQAVADVHAEAARAAAINVGGGVETVWLNGERVHTQRAYTGSYAGKERVPVRLRAGTNRIVVESSRNFFLSLTDAVDWPLPR